MTGFDLTAIKPIPSRNPAPMPHVYITPQQPQEPPPQPQALQDPNAPKTLNDALTKPVNSNLTQDDQEAGISGSWKDKRPPEMKKRLYSIDQFAHTTPKVIKIKVIDEKTKLEKEIYVDANGNLPVDPNTGAILTKAPPRERV